MAKQPFENVVQHLFQIAARAEFKTLSDPQLLQRYVDHRDELAFGELVRRNEPMVWNACWRVLGQHQDTEDAFQATFMALFRQAVKVRSHASIEGWLHHVACKLAHNLKRTRVRRQAREEWRAKMREESFNQSNRWELREVLDHELTYLPEKFRGPLILCYLEGLSQKQAAQRIGISVDVLEWRLRQGREQLRKRLSKRGLDLGPATLQAGVGHGFASQQAPPGLVEKTLDMVRILSQSNGALETTGISPQVAALVKGAMGLWTLKVKICLGILLLTVAGAGAGVAKYPGFFLNLMGWQQPRDKKQNPVNNKVDKTQANQIPQRMDVYGDPLPSGALARLGTVRFRAKSDGEIVFTPNSRAVGVLSFGEVPHLWDMKTGEPVRQFGDSLRGRHHAGSGLALDGRRVAYRHSTGVNGQKVEYQAREVATGKLIRAFEATGQDVHCCALAPDSKTLVGYFGGDLRLMDIATGRPIWTQKVWEQKMKLAGIRGLRSLVFSPDGKNVAAGYDFDDREKAKKGGIELRDARTGKSLRILGHPWNLERDDGNISFSPDGQTLMVVYSATGGKQTPSVYLWDVATGKERWHLDKEKHTYHHPSFSPDGKMMALYEIHYPIYKAGIGLYEVATGKRLTFFEGFGGGRLTFSPDGKVLASKQDSLIRCWDVATGKVLVSPPFGHESAVRAVAFASDGGTLVSAGHYQAVRAWDSFTGQRHRALSEESSLVTERLLSHGSQTSMVASVDGKIVAGARYEVPPFDEKQIASMPPESDDEVIEAIRASIRATIYIWEVATGRELRQIKLDCSAGPPRFLKLVLSPDGKFLALWWIRDGGTFDNVSVWEVATGKQIIKKVLGVNPIFSSDSTLLMTHWKSHKNQIFSFWEVSTGKKVSALDAGVKLENWPRLTVTPDWQTLVGVVCLDGAIHMSKQKYRWYLNSLHLDKQFKVSLGQPHYFDLATRYPPGLTAVSADGRLMAWSEPQHDKMVHVVETASGEERACFKGHHGGITALAFSSDGRRLASGSEDTTSLVWDMTGGCLDEHGQWRSVSLSDQQVKLFWGDLAASDGVQANRAIWSLTTAPKQTVSFLAKQMAPIFPKGEASPQRIAQLIVELDHEKYQVRHKADVELAKISEAAEAGIRKALEGKRLSAEVRRRLKQMLVTIEGERIKGPSGYVLRSIRAIEILERIGTPEARQLLETLSRGASGFRQTREAQVAVQRLQQTRGQR